MGASDLPERVAVPIDATGYVRMLPVGDVPPERVVLAVHGYGQSPRRFLSYVASLVPAGTLVVAPEGPSAFYRRPGGEGGAASAGIGYGWIADPERAASESRNTDLLTKAVALAATSYDVSTVGLTVLGYSQGVGVATHFAVAHADRVVNVVGLAGGVPASWRHRLTALRDTDVLWVTGTRDHAYVVSYNKALLAVWRETGVHLTHALLDADHDLLDDARDAVTQWLVDRMVGPR